MMKRRDALKTIGGLAGAASMAKFLPGCGGDDGPVGIKNYVYLMLENRTYDHVLGARAMEGLGGDGLRPGMSNPDMNNNPVGIFVPDRVGECALDPPHTWDRSHAQWNNGAMNGFVQQHQDLHSSTTAKEPMQYLTRTQIPVTWALADAYTTCDRWFASVMGPTFPNRAFWHTGTSFGLYDNAEIISKFSAGVPVPTIYNRLDSAGVDWAFYFGSYAVASLLGNPGPFQLDLGPNDGTGRIRRFGDPELGIGQFFKDAAAGKLPPVSYIDPTYDLNDDHPPVHPILAQQLISSIYIALAKSPQWKNTMLVITYDEHGGFFDHVAPPKTTDDTLQKFGVPGFDQLGFRVPAIIIGPYAKQGYVSSVQYDHSSALKHLENTFGLEPLTARVSAANDLSDCIDMDRLARGEPADPIQLPAIDISEWPYTDPSCKGGSNVPHAPLHQWLDANPGKFDPAYDMRGTDQQSVITSFLRENQDWFSKR